MMPSEKDTAGYRELRVALGRDPEGMVLDGRYRIVRHIASGGMGEVFEAAHVLIGARAAIKFLRPSLAFDEVLFERFKQEAAVAAETGGKVIARVQDFGLHENIPYMVMDYLEGQTLDKVIDGRRHFGSGEAASLLFPVACTLEKLHAKGIVHRDIKPSNFMVLKDEPGEEHLKLLDFGISMLRGGPEGRKLTESGTVLGTASYMSPEQAEGSEDIDHRTDLYAMGCVFYEMVTGHPPYEGRNYNEIIQAVVNRGFRDPRDYNDALGADVVEFIEKALRKNRDGRHQSAAEMARDLKRLGEGAGASPSFDDQGSAVKQTRIVKVGGRTGIRREWILVAAAVLLAAAAAVAFLVFRGNWGASGSSGPAGDLAHPAAASSAVGAHASGEMPQAAARISGPAAEAVGEAKPAEKPEEGTPAVTGAGGKKHAAEKKKTADSEKKKKHPYYGKEID